MGGIRTATGGAYFRGAGKRAGRLAAKGSARAAKELLETLLEGCQAPVTVRLWNGEALQLSASPRCAVAFRHPGALRQLVLKRDVLALAEAHLAGDIALEGDLEALIDLLEALSRRTVSLSTRAHLAWLALKIPARTSHHIAAGGNDTARPNTQGTITHHYALGNAFDKLWRDPHMLYSCADFRDEHQTLAAAQQDKLDYLCRKLRLAPGQTLLDIGCGWGALICQAAEHYGVRAHGITLSAGQRELAEQRIRERGLADRVSVSLCDYRDLPDGARYDRVVSVGMFEHVGVANFGAYFGTVKRVLKAGGLFLNHSITRDIGWRETSCTRFTNRYIFPDGELVRVSNMVDQMEQAGFEILDVEGMRRHYMMTVRRWIKALEAKRKEATALVGSPAWRAWRLYLAGAARSFNKGQMNLHQVLAGHARTPLEIPLRRDDLYRAM